MIATWKLPNSKVYHGLNNALGICVHKKHYQVLPTQMVPISALAHGLIIKFPVQPGLACGHDDVIKWKHFRRYWPFVRHKGQWRGALMFSLICTRINGWVNNGEAGDLRRHCAHYDVTVMGVSFANKDYSNKRWIEDIGKSLHEKQQRVLLLTQANNFNGGLVKQQLISHIVETIFIHLSMSIFPINYVGKVGRINCHPLVTQNALIHFLIVSSVGGCHSYGSKTVPEQRVLQFGSVTNPCDVMFKTKMILFGRNSINYQPLPQRTFIFILP